MRNAQNLVSVYHPTPQTESYYDIWFLVPVQSTAVQKVLNAFYGSGTILLADMPSSDKSLFPRGLLANERPVLVSAGCEYRSCITLLG
jgi:hypothetical protein